jgi:uncharacterized protein (DUF488 family)
VRYLFGGRNLGGRPSDASLYQHGQVSYELMARSEPILAGLRRLVKVGRRFRVALLCAEADPIECHRFLLIGRCLHERGISVAHIHGSGQLEAQRDAEQRMLAVLGLEQSDAFAHDDDVLGRAYQRQAARFAFARWPQSVAVSEGGGYESALHNRLHK